MENRISAQNDGLWNKLKAYEIDDPSSALRFSERAARDNGWSLGYSRRVIEEYKKFLFLAKRAGHIVCPSDAVDQIWHMHLTYTRSYWEELCGEVLESPLHHGPTKGGKEEKERYFNLYKKTLASYEHWFGEKPPTDIWPSVEQRFGRDLNFVRVNTQQHWIVPKFSRGQVVAGTAGAGLMIPLAQLAANPLDWRGPQFLALFFSLLVLSIVAAIFAQRWLLRSDEPFDFREDSQDDFGPIDAAYLEGGEHRALSCAMVDLAQADAITLDGSNVSKGPDPQNYKPKHRVSTLMLDSVNRALGQRSWTVLARDANPGLLATQQDLEAKGLLASSFQRTAAGAFTLSLVGAVLILGAAKIWVGIERNRPVGILVVGEILAGVALLVLLSTIPKLTQKGKRLLAKLKERMKSTSSNPNAIKEINATDTAGGDTLLWSTALLGTGALAMTDFAEYDGYLRNHTAPVSSNTSNSGGCGAACGGDGGGGGGGGCGGGCGGCGGCGG